MLNEGKEDGYQFYHEKGDYIGDTIGGPLTL